MGEQLEARIVLVKNVDQRPLQRLRNEVPAVIRLDSADRRVGARHPCVDNACEDLRGRSCAGGVDARRRPGLVDEVGPVLQGEPGQIGRGLIGPGGESLQQILNERHVVLHERADGQRTLDRRRFGESSPTCRRRGYARSCASIWCWWRAPGRTPAGCHRRRGTFSNWPSVALPTRYGWFNRSVTWCDCNLRNNVGDLRGEPLADQVQRYSRGERLGLKLAATDRRSAKRCSAPRGRSG